METQAISVCITALLCFACILNPAFAISTCKFPAIFNFGDSNSDTGGLSASYSPLPPPYGETFFHRPAGRNSDGRLIIDFMAKSFGFPYLSAYLDSLGSNFSHGANFAVASSTITPQHKGLSEGGSSPFYLDIQVRQFKEFRGRSQRIRREGGLFANLMPKHKYFSKALYTFDIGQNDLAVGFRDQKPIAEIRASVPNIIHRFSANIKDVYNTGARSIRIHNTGPIGCLSYFLFIDDSQLDSAGCAKPYNEVAQYFNYKLKEAVVQLRKDLPLASITYVDIYSIKYSFYSHPEKYGFQEPTVTCCGYGGKYNFSPQAFCGASPTINGSKVHAGSCEKPSVKVIWDGIHYTEAANNFAFSQISTAAFSDPPKDRVFVL